MQQIVLFSNNQAVEPINNERSIIWYYTNIGTGGVFIRAVPNIQRSSVNLSSGNTDVGIRNAAERLYRRIS
jgi:hypothetical protein